MFFDLFNNAMGRGKQEVPEQLSKFPKLVEHHKKVRDVPGIKAWLEKRPESEFWAAGITVCVWRHKMYAFSLLTNKSQHLKCLSLLLIFYLFAQSRSGPRGLKGVPPDPGGGG